jgi:hypothetical protein
MRVDGEMTNKMLSEKRYGIMELRLTKENSLMAKRTAVAGSCGVTVRTTRETLSTGSFTDMAHTTSMNHRKSSKDNSWKAELREKASRNGLMAASIRDTIRMEKRMEMALLNLPMATSTLESFSTERCTGLQFSLTGRKTANVMVSGETESALLG